jgi:apolipoprotein N-acyltransferase
LICFEDVFPELSRQFTKNGAQFLVNITNDAWYQHSFASYQHFQASVFRAVENRVVVLRSANTGVSGFISPEGRIISLVRDAKSGELFVDGFKSQSIPANKGATSIYTRLGDWFIIGLCFLIVAIFLLTGRDRRRRKKDNV